MAKNKKKKSRRATADKNRETTKSAAKSSAKGAGRRMTREDARRIAMYVMLGVAGIAAVHIVQGIVSILNDPATSFPWWSAIIMNGAYYVFPFAASAAVYIVLSVRSGRGK